MPVGVNLMEAQYYTGLPKTGSMTGTAEMDCNDITTVISEALCREGCSCGRCVCHAAQSSGLFRRHLHRGNPVLQAQPLSQISTKRKSCEKVWSELWRTGLQSPATQQQGVASLIQPRQPLNKSQSDVGANVNRNNCDICVVKGRLASLEASALILMLSRRDAASLAFELDSNITIAKSVSACTRITSEPQLAAPAAAAPAAGPLPEQLPGWHPAQLSVSFQIPAAASSDGPAADCWPRLWPPAGQIPPAGSAAAAASHWGSATPAAGITR
ncbi:MAG: hypothetical protein FRX49_04256 [Trebouxia sp. A1-2]|nr:MAG: hypothetical protein FRX49_04256 [Trebouxia sp. A1-2]